MRADLLCADHVKTRVTKNPHVTFKQHSLRVASRNSCRSHKSMLGNSECVGEGTYLAPTFGFQARAAPACWKCYANRASHRRSVVLDRQALLRLFLNDLVSLRPTDLLKLKSRQGSQSHIVQGSEGHKVLLLEAGDDLVQVATRVCLHLDPHPRPGCLGTCKSVSCFWMR